MEEDREYDISVNASCDGVIVETPETFIGFTFSEVFSLEEARLNNEDCTPDEINECVKNLKEVERLLGEYIRVMEDDAS